MEHWWISLSLFEKVLWFITIPASVIFVIQMIMTFIGMDGDSMDIDDSSNFGEEPMHIFTFRNFINFFLGFGWSGIAFYNVIENKFILVALAAIIGALLVAAVMYIFILMSRMVQSGTMNVENAVDKIAEVYLTIPEYQSGYGKVTIKIQNTFRELDAVTNGIRIPTGSSVRVKEVLSNGVLLVESI